MPEHLENTHNFSSRWKNIERNRVYHCAADALLWRLPKRSVDVFWFSPPYNLDDKFRGGNHNKTGVKIQYGIRLTSKGDGTSIPESVYQAQQQMVLGLCYEALKPNGVLFYSHKIRLKNGEAINPGEWIRRSGLYVIQEVIWDRSSTAQGDPRRLHPVYETIYILAKRPAAKSHLGEPFKLQNAGKRIGGPGYSDVWHIHSGNNRSVTGHPCATPTEIVERCFNVVPLTKGMLVCDPYCGTGTTGRVAQAYGADYLLCDVDAHWATYAEKNVKGDTDDRQQAFVQQLWQGSSEENSSIPSG
jgi:DNA modification methylase